MLYTIKFVLKQLLPFKYETICRITDDSGENELIRTKVTWRMWLGKPFNIRSYEL